MKKKYYIVNLWILLVLFFLLARIAFLFYNQSFEPFSFEDAIEVLCAGCWTQDLYVAGLLLLVPSTVLLCATYCKRIPIRSLLLPYFLLVSFVVGIVLVGDTIMYEFWQFKLNAIILSYASHPEGATSSVDTSFIFACFGALLGVIAVLTTCCMKLTPSSSQVVSAASSYRRNAWLCMCVVVVLHLFNFSDQAYDTQRKLFLNHATINPLYSFFSSFHTGETYAKEYEYEEADTCLAALQEFFPNNLTDIKDTLLTTQRPHILVVLMESFGGTFIQELGGYEQVAPQFSRLITEGIFWENYYSNSFRTDRGVASLVSGNVSYPQVSLMVEKQLHTQLPSLAKTLNAHQYNTKYIYGGPMTNMGKRTYLENCQFQELIDHTYFAKEELTSSWGADDEIVAQRAYHLFAQATDSEQPLFMVFQTISSHEPWVVPYHRLDDKVLNAFAYTDQCLGNLIDSLRTLPVWDDLLVILIPDHGHLYHQSYEDPLFFHSPMLWLGGAIRKPQRMPMWMNQNDIAATLFAQMGIGHDEYRWSRNVLSAHYTYPFVYCNFPSGILWADSTGVSIWDITAQAPIMGGDDAQGEARIRNAQRLLQGSHLILDKQVNQIVPRP